MQIKSKIFSQKSKYKRKKTKKESLECEAPFDFSCRWSLALVIPLTLY